jgi:hypothetical protein
MSEQPKTNLPKPEPTAPEPRERARDALQTSMDRRG